jgi:aminoglycoside phosphotransferase (APT) family kinase protein
LTLTSALALDRATEGIRPAAVSSLRGFVEDSGLRAVVIGHSKDPNAKLTMMLISPRSGRAALAVKAPTSDIAGDAVEAEMRMLLGLHKVCPASLAQSIPRVIDLVEFDGRTALVTTAVAGTSMTTSYLRWRHTARPALVAGDFAAAGAWLARLQEATAGGSAPLDIGEGVVPRLRARFAGDAQLEADLERLATLRAGLRSNRVPRCAAHGDFWMGNILLSRGLASGVVDWEAGVMAGDPVRDLVRFGLMYALYLDLWTRAGRRVAGHGDLHARSWGAGIAYAMDGRGWFPELFRRFLRDGLRRCGAPAESWREVVLVGLAETAAFTDDPEFGRRHLQLFRRLSIAGPRLAAPVR